MKLGSRAFTLRWAVFAFAGPPIGGFLVMLWAAVLTDHPTSLLETIGAGVVLGYLGGFAPGYATGLIAERLPPMSAARFVVSCILIGAAVSSILGLIFRAPGVFALFGAVAAASCAVICLLLEREQTLS